MIVTVAWQLHPYTSVPWCNPIRFLHWEDSPEFTNMQIIRQLQTMQPILRKGGDIERPATQEELDAKN